VIKRTIATKMATMSKVFRTLGRIPPAMRSERRTSPPPLSAVVAIEPNLLKKFCSKEGYRHLNPYSQNGYREYSTEEKSLQRVLESPCFQSSQGDERLPPFYNVEEQT
jgi:hypothetical protein